MMNTETPDQDRENTSEELDGRLRAAVEKILNSAVPEELMRGSVGQLKREGPPSVLARKSGRNHVAWAITLAVAASLAGIILLRQFYAGGPGQPKIAEAGKPPATVPTNDAVTNSAVITGVDHPPTFWTYHQATRRSIESLDALLDEHAQQLSFSEPTFFPFGQSPNSQKETL